MKKTLYIFATLLFASFLLNEALNFMSRNIGDFESVPLPPKKLDKIVTVNPTLKVDATSRNKWTLLNFETGKMIQIEDDQIEDKKFLEQHQWDMAFQRTKIVTNSGVTNPSGTVGILNMGPVNFDKVREIPEGNFTEDSKSFGKVINKAISDWYNYRTRTHNVESKKNVYILRTSGGRFLKFRILNYYCSHNESDCRTVMCGREEAACLTIEYVMASPASREFPPPPSPQMVMKVGESLPNPDK